MCHLVLVASIVGAMISLSTTTAFAKTKATPTEQAAVKKSFAAFVAERHSPAAKDDRVASVSVSSVNASYAFATISSKSAGPSEALLHKTTGTWKVIDFGSGAFPCSDATKKVMKDLVGGCIPS